MKTARKVFDSDRGKYVRLHNYKKSFNSTKEQVILEQLYYRAVSKRYECTKRTEGE
jgi:hypothetical protein